MKANQNTTCPVCGKKFTTRANQLYCSKDCKDHARRKKCRKHEEYGICRICGNMFKRGKQKIYCSPECAAKYVYAYAKKKGTISKPDAAPTVVPGKPHIPLNEAVRMASAAGKTYGEMFAPKVEVEIPSWVRECE